MTTDVINGVPRSLLEGIADHLEWDGSEPLTTIQYAYKCDDLARDLRALLATAQPAADGEREAFEAWFTDTYTAHKLSPRLTNCGIISDGYSDSRVDLCYRGWQARAAQPQQAVAVTDEVRRLREALERVKLTEKEARHHSFSCALYWNNAVTACIAALSAHKTGEEE